MLRLSFRLLFVLVFIFVSFNSYAFYPFYIKDYYSEIYIHKNATVDVKEVIKVHFNIPRHGIYRDIPYRYEIKNKPKDGAERPFSLQNSFETYIYDIQTPGFKNKIRKHGNYIRIRIGDSDRYADADMVYTIKYSVFGLINFFKDHSEFYFNIVGNGWRVPIKHTSFDIIFPSDISKEQIRYEVYSGYYGSRHKEGNVIFEDSVLSCYDCKPLNPRESLTVLIAMPKGYLINGGSALKFRLFIENNKVFFIPIFVFLILFIVWLVVGRDEKRAILTYYKPPKNITPAEAGLLIDDKIDNRDLLSLIYYWASNGYLEIEESEDKSSFFKKKDYVLKKIKDLPDDAKEFEKIIFNGLFSGKIKAVRVSTLKNKFYDKMKMARESLNEYVKDKKVYVKGTRWLSKALIFISFAVFSYAFISFSYGGFASFFAYLITGFVILFFGKIMPKKTPKGLSEYGAVRGFKEFMDRVEKDRLKRLLEEDPEYFYKTLSYAIAFGEHKKWADKFSDLVTEPPRWYHGTGYRHGTFSTYMFVDSLNSSMTSMNNAFMSTPSSAASGSSGFGGGGFSGGGMGGGGGGSW